MPHFVAILAVVLGLWIYAWLHSFVGSIFPST